jgi:hypothetical protein
MNQSSSKTWSNEEDLMLLMEVKMRNLTKLYNKKPHLPEHSSGTRQLVLDLNKEHGKSRSAGALAARFYEFRENYGWPEALEVIRSDVYLTRLQAEEAQVVNESEDGLMLINVKAFQHYVLSPEHDYNSALLAARVA